VVALDRLTLAALHRQWSAGAVLKEYRAVVHGAPQPASGIIELPLGATGARRRPVAVDLQAGRAAVTRYDTVAVDGNRTLLALFPETGRTHQLRVHLAAIGHPIVGDWRYGSEERAAPRHWLHCLRTTLRHPQDDRTLVLEAPLPAAWPLRENSA
jgi:23S rRNA-/tRNA-specific pseudouridylate synthase